MNKKNENRKFPDFPGCRETGILALIAAVLMLFTGIGTAITPHEEWNWTYGGTDNQIIYSAQQTQDGGYILAGQISVPGAGTDVWLIKTDLLGREQWNRTFGGLGSDYALAVQQTSDDGYVVLAHTDSYGADADVWLIKVDSLGNDQWNSTAYGLLRRSILAYSVLQTSGDGFIFVGTIEASTPYYVTYDALVIKTDSLGNEQWSEIFPSGLGNIQQFRSIQPASDGDYILAGTSYPSRKAWLAKINSTGSMKWEAKFSYGLYDDAYDARQALDGGYVLTGNAYTWYQDASDVWLIKTNSTGGLEWTKIFAGKGHDVANSVGLTSNTGYVIGGTIDASQHTGDGWLIKTNLFGDEEWNLTFGGAEPERIYSAQQTQDGGYFLAGSTSSFGSGSVSAWLIKVSNETYNGTLHFINGTVMDSVSKIGLASVNVSVNATISTTTNAVGFYSLSVGEGIINLTSDKNDIRYYVNSTSVSTFGRMITAQDINLVKKPTGNITGVVRIV